MLKSLSHMLLLSCITPNPIFVCFIFESRCRVLQLLLLNVIILESAHYSRFSAFFSVSFSICGGGGGKQGGEIVNLPFDIVTLPPDLTLLFFQI